MLAFDLEGTENDSDSISITRRGHILMGAVISLPSDVQVPLDVTHFDLESLLGLMCYLCHVGVVYELVGEIICIIAQIVFARKEYSMLSLLVAFQMSHFK